MNPANNAQPIIAMDLNGFLIPPTNMKQLAFTIPMNGPPTGTVSFVDYENQITEGSKITSVGNIATKYVVVGGKTNTNSLQVTTYSMSVNNLNPHSDCVANFSAQNASTLSKQTVAMSGTSMDCVKRLLEKCGFQVDVKLDKNDKLARADEMTWRFVQDNVWDQLNWITEHSYRPNDFMFWAYDDTTGKFKVSSFNTEKKSDPVKYMFVQSQNAMRDNLEAALHNDKYDADVFFFDAFSKTDTLASNMEAIFPNVIISGTTFDKKGGIIAMALTKLLGNDGTTGTQFSQFLKSQGDTKQKDIAARCGFTDTDVALGPLQLINHFPQNVHRYYSIAPVCRKRELATYSKMVKLYVINNIGPSVGSYCDLFIRTPDRAHLDNRYSGEYILLQKTIRLNNVMKSLTGDKPAQTPIMVTEMLFVSDQYNLLQTDKYDEIYKEVMA